MFAVTVKIETSQADAMTFLSLVRQNAVASLNAEPGCHQFDVCAASDRRGEFFLYEIYDDAAAFDAHLKTDHFLNFDRDTAKMILTKEVTVFDDVFQ